MACKHVEEVFMQVVNSTGLVLKPLGFIRNGRVLRIVDQGIAGIIEFQRSSKSSASKLLFTVNLGVVYGELLDTGIFGLQKARVVDAHVGQRIGMLLPGHPDKWWEISENTNGDVLVREVSELISEICVSYIRFYFDRNVVMKLWESGSSPGLTDRQRVAFLSRLKGIINDG